MRSLPTELFQRIAHSARDSTSRVRMAAAFGRRSFLLSHDSRLSLLEFIHRSTGDLRLKRLETLLFLRQHESALVAVFDGCDVTPYADLIEAIRDDEHGRVAASCDFHPDFHVNWTVAYELGLHATPDLFDAFPSSRAFAEDCFSGFSHGAHFNARLLAHVSHQDWFTERLKTQAYPTEISLDVLGGSRDDWMRLVELDASSEHTMSSVRRVYGKMPRTVEA